MRICTACNTSNTEGLFFCEECGQPIYGKYGVLTTRHIPTHELARDGGTNSLGFGTAVFAHEKIIFRINGTPEPVILEPKEEMLLGRADTATQVSPALDFTPYGAQENGISRLHAAIRRNDNTLTLVDLGSVNGTSLNGQRLAPNQPRVLRDGDEVQLGKLIFRVYFK